MVNISFHLLFKLVRMLRYLCGCLSLVKDSLDTGARVRRFTGHYYPSNVIAVAQAFGKALTHKPCPRIVGEFHTSFVSESLQYVLLQIRAIPEDPVVAADERIRVVFTEGSQGVMKVLHERQWIIMWSAIDVKYVHLMLGTQNGRGRLG